MPNKSAKTLAIEEIIKELENQRAENRCKINNFKWKYQNLVNEQTILKRKQAQLSQLIRDLKGRDNG